MKVMPLTDLKPGQKAIVHMIDAGWGATRRLLDLGITPGQEIEILQRIPFHGPVRIKVRGADVAIGRGIAMKVLVAVDEDQVK